MRRLIRSIVGAMLVSTGVAQAQPASTGSGQAYPSKPIRMVVPFAPGGATDIVGRILAPKLGERLGQQVVVDNRAGAAGNIAVEIVASAQPDGHTILVGNISTNSINHLLFKKMKVNAVRDLAPITLLASIPNVILGGPKMPANFKEALAFVRERPGQLNFQAPLGSYSHLDMLALTAAAGLKMVHLPSKGAGETLTALMRGDVHITNSNVASNIGAIRAGQIKAYAVTSQNRIADLPDVPTLTEAGFAGIGSLNWNGLFVPAATPHAIIDRIFKETVAVMGDPEMKDYLAKRLIPLALSESPAAFNAYVLSESKRWDKIIRDNKVAIE